MIDEPPATGPLRQLCLLASGVQFGASTTPRSRLSPRDRVTSSTPHPQIVLISASHDRLDPRPNPGYSLVTGGAAPSTLPQGDHDPSESRTLPEPTRPTSGEIGADGQTRGEAERYQGELTAARSSAG